MAARRKTLFAAAVALGLGGCETTGAAVLAALVTAGENHIDRRALARERCEGQREQIRLETLNEIKACITRAEGCPMDEIDQIIAVGRKALTFQSSCDDDVPDLFPFSLDHDFFGPR